MYAVFESLGAFIVEGAASMFALRDSSIFPESEGRRQLAEMQADTSVDQFNVQYVTYLYSTLALLWICKVSQSMLSNFLRVRWFSV